MHTTDPLLALNRGRVQLKSSTLARFVKTNNFALCIFILFSSEPVTAQPVFSVEREFGPVRLTQQQVVELTTRLQVFAERQGSATGSSDRVSHRLLLSDGQNALEVTEEVSLSALASAPPVATTLRYSRRSRMGAIRAIRLDFTDTLRTLEVAGQSQDQVEAVANLAGDIVSQSEAIFGGSRRRTRAGFLMFWFALVLMLTAQHASLPLHSTSPVRLVMFVVGLCLSISIWLVPWSEMFPGVAVYRDDVSFLVRHQALISFLGLVATIAFGIAGVVRYLRRSWDPRIKEPKASMNAE
jgi:hypothetical protein